MMVAKRANKCWSSVEIDRRPRRDAEGRKEGADRASARRFVARAIRRRQNGLSGRAAYVRPSGRGRQLFESCNCHEYQDIDRLARDSPWQNGYCERAIGSIRRECLDHVVVFGERHLRHLLRSYATYYNEARTHLSVNKDAPSPRTVHSVGRIRSE